MRKDYQDIWDAYDQSTQEINKADMEIIKEQTKDNETKYEKAQTILKVRNHLKGVVMEKSFTDLSVEEILHIVDLI